MGPVLRPESQPGFCGVPGDFSGLLCLAIGGPSYFGGMAYRNGQWPYSAVCMVILVVALAATVYISVPQMGWQADGADH